MLATIGRTVIVVFAIIGFIFAVAGILLNSCAPSRAYVRVAPPPPRHEVIPPRPHPNAVWMEGEWAWAGNNYVWVPGRWETKPRGDVWLAGHWAKTPRGWVYVDGRWSR